MRKAIHPEKRHQSFGVSFPPDLRQAARKRAYNLEVNLSRYLQHLVEADLGTTPLPAAFEQSGGLRSKSKGTGAQKLRNTPRASLGSVQSPT